MGSLRRMLISFIVLFDILAFSIIFVIMSNTSMAEQEDLIYMTESDGALTGVIAFVGVVANMVLAYVLWRGSHATRRLDVRDGAEPRSRITGE